MSQSKHNKYPEFLFGKSVVFVLVIIYLILSGLYLNNTYTKTIHEKSQIALQLAQTIAKSINVNRLSNIQASISELTNPDYLHFKNKLIALHKVNNEARFLYFLKQSGNKIYFLVDSEPATSVDYSAPGDEYQNDNDSEIFIPFNTGNAIVTQPTTDKWGNWVSVLVPIVNPKTGHTDLLFCMDYDSAKLQQHAWQNVIQATIMLVAILLFILSMLSVFKKNARQKQFIKKLIEIQKELESQKELAEAANKSKSQFLSNMSHEIRTPLNGVIGFAELLRNTELSNVQKEYVENALSSANTLMGVINDILDFSKIEAGRLELEQIKTDVFVLLDNAADIIKLLAAKKGLELLLNIQPDMPRFLYIDPIRTKQILVNLLNNAVKFTHAGEVELKVRFEKKTNRTGVICFSIRDTGVGISESDRKKLFKAFSQADTSTTRRYGGTGLGLIISNSLAEKMGGKITFDSTPGQGTEFTFCFETGYENGSSVQQSKTTDIKSVLVIDDNLNNRTILEHTFNFWNIPFTGVESGFAALELLENNQRFDLIIVDYHMPDMNGIDTIRNIRKLTDPVNYNQHIIILHSSSDDSSLFQAAAELRVKYMLTKPIKQDELYHYLCNLDQNSTAVESENLGIVTPKSAEINKNEHEAEYKILVAEDTRMNMLVIRNMLKNYLPNTQIFEAENGLKAVELVFSIFPDLVLMDVQMPELDGIGATQNIRENSAADSIPIIALTAGVSVDEREACYAAGMNDFLAKPIVKSELERVIQTYLFPLVKNNTSNGKSLSESTQGHFDREKLLSKIGNEDTLNEILKLSLTEYPNYIKELEYAINTFDADMIKRYAHKIKGSALNMEFQKLAKIALKIEELHADQRQVQKKFVKLCEEWKTIQTILVS